MRILLWILRAGCLLLLFAFAFRNLSIVQLRLFSDTVWDVPLIVVILFSFVMGILMGIGALLRTIIGLRRELALARQSQADAEPVASPDQLRGQLNDLPDSF